MEERTDHPDIEIEQVEESICQVEGVKAARIVTGDNSDIEEVHIICTAQKEPKQLARDVESLLMARYGLAIDHRKISIAQVGQNGTRRFFGARPRIKTVKTETNETGTKVAVVLEARGEDFEGAANGRTSRKGRVRLVAQATLEAVEKLVVMPEGEGFALEDVSVIPLGREKVALACITLVGSQKEQVFTGSAPVRYNEHDAVVRATLDAINRRFGFLTTS